MSKKNVPFHGRTAVRQITLEQRLAAVVTFNNDLLSILHKHLPGTQQDVAQLKRNFGQQMAKIDELEGELTLRGHGVRGVIESQKLVTAADLTKFEARLPKAAENPLTGENLQQALATYLMAEVQTQQGAGHAWVLPDAKTYGQLVNVLSNGDDTDLTEMKEGIYVVNDGQNSFYTVKIDLDEGFLIFSPGAGPSLVTYSEIEKRFVQHTAFKFADNEHVMRQIEAFFAKSSIHDVSVSELKKLGDRLRKLPAAMLESVAQLEESTRVLTVPINELYLITYAPDSEPTLTSVRDDKTWTDLPLFNRRQLFRNLIAKVEGLEAGVKGLDAKMSKLANAAPSTKKAVKKTPAKKAASK